MALLVGGEDLGGVKGEDLGGTAWEMMSCIQPLLAPVFPSLCFLIAMRWTALPCHTLFFFLPQVYSHGATNHGLRSLKNHELKQTFPLLNC